MNISGKGGGRNSSTSLSPHFNIDEVLHEHRKPLSQKTKQTKTQNILMSKPRDMLRQISSCGTNWCNSADGAGRLITPAETFDPLSDIFMTVITPLGIE